MFRRVLIRTLLVFALLLVPASLSFRTAMATTRNAAPTLSTTAAGAGVVHAVLFWMSTCGHCHKVMTEDLPPLQQKFGDKLDITMIEASTPENWSRLQRAAAALGLKPEEAGVPLMIIGDHLLLGSVQIPLELPVLIDQYLAAGGVDLPNLPGLESIAIAPPTVAIPPGPSLARGNEGYGVAWSGMVILVLALLYALVATVWRLLGHHVPQGPDKLKYLTLILCLLGMAVALYLSYIEITATKAACGPVGDCNAVQSSPYARIFGVIPMGLFGLFGYIGIIAAWIWHERRNDLVAAYMPLAILGMTIFGVVFSMYLTYLEIFVIHAVCLWCLTSALVIAFLLVVSVGPAMASVATSSSE